MAGEAGHAVAAHLLGRKVLAATLHAEPPWDGQVVYSPAPRARDRDVKKIGTVPPPLLPPRLRRSVESTVMICLAGRRQDAAFRLLTCAKFRFVRLSCDTRIGFRAAGLIRDR